jgi:hypothetical protein
MGNYANHFDPLQPILIHHDLNPKSAPQMSFVRTNHGDTWGMDEQT